MKRSDVFRTTCFSRATIISASLRRREGGGGVRGVGDDTRGSWGISELIGDESDDGAKIAAEITYTD